MPTKLSEYLASGIPTILYCPGEIALARYLIPCECTINCQEKDSQHLSEAIKKLEDNHLCSSVVAKALDIAQKHDVQVERNRFEMTILSFCGHNG